MPTIPVISKSTGQTISSVDVPGSQLQPGNVMSYGSGTKNLIIGVVIAVVVMLLASKYLKGGRK